MNIKNAIMLLEHTSYDDFNLLDHQIKGRLKAIECIINELKKKDEVIKKAIEYIEETSIGSILEVHCGCEEDYIEPLLQILEEKETDINVGEVE